MAILFADCRRIPEPNPREVAGLSGLLRVQVQTRERRVGFTVMVCASSDGNLRAEALDITGSSIWILEIDQRHGRLIDLRSRCAIRLRSLTRITKKAIGIELDGNTFFRILDVMSSQNMEMTDSVCRDRSATLSVEPDPGSGLQAVVLSSQDQALKVRLTWLNLPDLHIGGCLDRSGEMEYEDCRSNEIRELWEEWMQ